MEKFKILLNIEKFLQTNKETLSVIVAAIIVLMPFIVVFGLPTVISVIAVVSFCIIYAIAGLYLWCWIDKN